jgi:hypothetical protein
VSHVSNEAEDVHGSCAFGRQNAVRNATNEAVMNYELRILIVEAGADDDSPFKATSGERLTSPGALDERTFSGV